MRDKKSLAMLKLLDDFNQSSNFGILNNLDGPAMGGAGSKASKETNSKSSSLANRSKKRQVKKDEVDEIFLKHDGLFVDYNKFGDLTKDMLRNSHVVRNKSIKSPPRII